MNIDDTGIEEWYPSAHMGMEEDDPIEFYAMMDHYDRLASQASAYARPIFQQGAGSRRGVDGFWDRTIIITENGRQIDRETAYSVEDPEYDAVLMEDLLACHDPFLPQPIRRQAFRYYIKTPHGRSINFRSLTAD